VWFLAISERACGTGKVLDIDVEKERRRRSIFRSGAVGARQPFSSLPELGPLGDPENDHAFLKAAAVPSRTAAYRGTR
jgi:hypothetical protein